MPRPGIDDAALTNPDHVDQWLDSMTDAESTEIIDSSRTQAQALYGTKVEILGYQQGWYHIAVSGEPTPKNSFGYPGWVPSVQVAFNTTFGKLQATRPFALADKGSLAALYTDSGLTNAFINITYNTQLPVLGSDSTVVRVALPSGLSAFLPKSSATIYDSASEIPYPTGQDLVKTAELFYGRPYLWGGSSTYGFDCSGLTLTLYDSHGITIPRDADAQADFTGHGTPVDRADLQVGDLIFYADNVSDPSTIYHVAMYAGNDMMIEAYDVGTPVRLTPVRFIEEYWGAQRFLTR